MSDLTLLKTSPALPLDNSQPGTHNIWIKNAERNAEVARKDGFSKSTNAWIYARDGDIPPNAIVWGYDDGEPSYVCRSLEDGKMYVGKVTRNRAAAVFHWNGSRAFHMPVTEYEVLVELRMAPIRWVHEEAIRSTETLDVYGLSKLKLVVLVDDSHSMDLNDLWPEAKEALAGVAQLFGQHNTDGIDLYFLNDTNNQSVGLKDRKEVLRLFDTVVPKGQTPTGRRLRDILNTYISQLEDRTVSHKPISIVVITDGAPDDKKELEDTIVSAAGRLKQSGINSRELGIQFVQIGKDAGAEEYLKYLDNGLREQYKVDDIVDSTTFDPKEPRFKTDRLLKIVKGAVDKSIDQGLSTRL